MATDTVFMPVTLDEQDIPGASFQFASIEKHSVAQLQRWLECRRLRKTGKKDVLIKRCYVAVEQKTALNPAVDGGKWYDIKAAQVKSQRTLVNPTDVPYPPIIGWKEFPQSGVPKLFNSGHIYHYLIESIQGSDEHDPDSDPGSAGTDFQTAKPLRRGQQFYESGNVTKLQDYRKDEHYYLKAKVLASMRQTTYSVLVHLSAATGFIRDASCECKCSALGSCSHVAAVLHAVDVCLKGAGANSDDADVPCTSKPMTWNMGRKLGKDPQKITETVYKIKHRKMSSLIDFDPRPVSLRQDALDKAEQNQFLIGLQQTQPDQSTNKSMWETILSLKYDDYKLSPDEADLLRTKVDILISNLSANKDGPQEVTSTQGSDQWMAQRRLRVTASNAKSVFSATSDLRRHNIVKSQLWDNSPKTAAMAYGNKHEATARDAFAKQYGHFHVTDTGFWINNKYPGLGASPDGLICDRDNQELGILEIKCPATLKSVTPIDFCKVLNKAQQSSFCLAANDGEYALKKSHSYYYQMQLQMAILQRLWGYFVVWSPHGLFCEKVQFDEGLFNKMLPVLTDFHRNILCPEEFEMRIPRELLVLNLNNETIVR